jgi:hypothetical protein
VAASRKVEFRTLADDHPDLANSLRFDQDLRML